MESNPVQPPPSNENQPNGVDPSGYRSNPTPAPINPEGNYNISAFKNITGGGSEQPISPLKQSEAVVEALRSIPISDLSESTQGFFSPEDLRHLREKAGDNIDLIAQLAAGEAERRMALDALEATGIPPREVVRELLRRNGK